MNRRSGVERANAFAKVHYGSAGRSWVQSLGLKKHLLLGGLKIAAMNIEIQESWKETHPQK